MSSGRLRRIYGWQLKAEDPDREAAGELTGLYGTMRPWSFADRPWKETGDRIPRIETDNCREERMNGSHLPQASVVKHFGMAIGVQPSQQFANATVCQRNT
jgi:hypothetical protein